MTAKLHEIVSHKELSDFFHPGFLIYTERPILHRDFKNIKPDRVAINGTKAYIIDYKTGEEHQKHRQQVYEYAFALEEMGCEDRKSTRLNSSHVRISYAVF